MPACHGDSCNRQLPSDGADAAVWGSHSGDPRGSWDCCQLSPVSRSLALEVAAFCAVYCEYMNMAWLCAFRVIIHMVSKCHEEGLEHYLRSFIKVTCFYDFYPFYIKMHPVFSVLYVLLFCSMCLWLSTLQWATQRPLMRCWPWPWLPPSSKSLITISAISCSRCVSWLCPVHAVEDSFSCSTFIAQQVPVNSLYSDWIVLSYASLWIFSGLLVLGI